MSRFFHICCCFGVFVGEEPVNELSVIVSLSAV